jgi:hypothetical protein
MDTELDWKAEYEKEMARAAELKEHIRGFMIGEAVKAEARAFGTIDPELVVKLADTSGCSFDEDSNVVIGASEAVQQLVAEKPYLFGRNEVKKIPPPPRTKNGLLDAVQKELGIRKF